MVYYLLKCPVCNKMFRHREIVLLNDLDTIVHLRCQYDYPFPIGTQAVGRYGEIMNQYEAIFNQQENQTMF